MTMISWRKSLTSAVAVAAVAVVGATSLAGDAAAQEERIRWRVPGAFPTSLPALGDNLVWVADQLNAASGGTIEFRVAEPGELVRNSMALLVMPIRPTRWNWPKRSSIS